MKNRRILEVYETRNVENPVSSFFSDIDAGELPEDINTVLKSFNGFVDIGIIEKLPDKSHIIIQNVEIPTVKNLIDICRICFEKECGILLFTDTITKYDLEIPDYKEYLSGYYGDGKVNLIQYPDEWVD